MIDQRAAPARSRVALLLVLALAITVLFLVVIQDFVLALVMAAVLAGMARPVYARLVELVRGREGIAALLTVILILAIIIVPTLILLNVLMVETLDVAESVEAWVETQRQQPGGLRRAVEDSPTFQKLLPYQDQIVQKAGQLIGTAASMLAQAVVNVSMGAAQFFLMLFVALYATFFFLKGGRAIVDAVFGFTPLTTDDKQRLVTTFSSVARATLKGTLVISIIQGALGGAAFAVAGIEGAVFWGAVMAFMSILPGLGTGFVWVPAVIYLAMIDRVGAAVGLAAWCAVVVGTVDNYLRPMLIGKDTKMPDLLVLITTLGGLACFGMAGVVLGPVVGALFITGWTLWRYAVEDAEGEAPEVTG